MSAEEAVATAEVSVVDNGFEPSAIEVSAGDTVTWTWSGSAPHDVDGEGLQSEVQSTGTSQHTFDTVGEYQYVCNIHSGMTGLVVVTDLGKAQFSDSLPDRRRDPDPGDAGRALHIGDLQCQDEPRHLWRRAPLYGQVSAWGRVKLGTAPR